MGLLLERRFELHLEKRAYRRFAAEPETTAGVSGIYLPDIKHEYRVFSLFFLVKERVSGAEDCYSLVHAFLVDLLDGVNRSMIVCAYI